MSPCQALGTRDHGSMGESYSPECVEGSFPEGEAARLSGVSLSSVKPLQNLARKPLTQLLYAERIAAHPVTTFEVKCARTVEARVRPGSADPEARRPEVG